MIVGQDVQVGPGGSLALLMRAERPRRDYPASADDLREAIHRSEFYERIDRYFRRAELTGSRFRAAIPGNAYVVSTGASAIALAAATAKTLWYINSAAANQPSFVEISLGFDGVTASAVPALVELVFGTKASNSTPGTGSTTFTPLQIRGWPAQTSAQAAANNCSAEPTVLTSIKQWLVSPNGGLIVIQAPMGREPTGVASGTALSGNQVGLRATAPAIVNARSYGEYEE